MESKVEGTRMGFLRKITRKWAQQKSGGIWDTPRSEVVCEAVGTQLTTNQIERRQVTVAQWVVLRPIFEV